MFFFTCSIPIQLDADDHDYISNFPVKAARSLPAKQQLRRHRRWATGDLHGSLDNVREGISISEMLRKARTNDKEVSSELSDDYITAGKIYGAVSPTREHNQHKDLQRALMPAGIELLVKAEVRPWQ